MARKRSTRIKFIGPLKTTGAYKVSVVDKPLRGWTPDQTAEWICDGLGQCEIVLLDTPNKRWDAVHEIVHATYPDMDEGGVYRLVENLRMLSEIAPELWPEA